ncbi:arylamine N-acetyltransferase [Paenibacillus yanchengensis]|uniref:Arylamine N-acetyltransferase n=1 Tax=Paenibacillus yanchengensis TaxID=2035833 RepID=A0ABW4YFF1_9BACL
MQEQPHLSVDDYLKRIGFTGSWRDEEDPPPKRRHRVLVVEAEGERWLCDVGVGGIVPQTPILLVEAEEQQQGDECYKLEQHPLYGWVLLERKRGDWKWLYSFTEEPQLAKDYVMASYWCEHSPASIFTQITMVAIRTADGRNTLHGDEFRIFTNDRVEVLVAQSSEQYEQFLAKYFGIIRH